MYGQVASAPIRVLASTCIVVSLHLAAAGNELARACEANGEAGDSLLLDERHLRVLESFDEDVPKDSAAILEQAGGLAREFQSRLDDLEENAGHVAVRQGAHLGIGRPCPCDEMVLQAVHGLGEVSQRVHAARAWTDFAIREQRLKLGAARRQACLRNLAELDRVYTDYQNAVALRRDAMVKLRMLATGRARVVRVDTYHNLTSPASPMETHHFATGLAWLAMSRIRVAPPARTKAKDIFSIDELLRLKKQEPELRKLGGLVDSRLRQMAAMHLQSVEAALKLRDIKRRSQAISSLGWWNGPEGRQLIDNCLADRSETVRGAALLALWRLRHSPSSLNRYARHKMPEVRMAAIRLAAEQLQDFQCALQVVRTLMGDDDSKVRAQAYAALDHLAAVFNMPFAGQVRNCVAVQLRSSSPQSVLDAIHWVVEQGDNESSKDVRFKRFVLSPLLRHRDEAVQDAAQKALRLLATSR
jgi:hypothetical protein